MSTMNTSNTKLSEIFDDLAVSVYQAEGDVVDSLCRDGERRVKELMLEIVDRQIETAKGDKAELYYLEKVREELGAL